MTSEARKSQLIAAGYSIEDMGAEWGTDFTGQYRWLNAGLKGDGWGVPQFSEEDAWADAAQFQRKYLIAELDDLLGAPDGCDIALTAEEAARVTEIQQTLQSIEC